MPFFGIGMKTDLFQAYEFSTAEFSKFADILSAALSQHHRLGLELAGIPLPPLPLFGVMFPKALLTSHFKMSGSR